MTKAAGKYVHIDVNHPEALGVCDVSGLVFNKRDLVKQMRWAGSELVWTGLLVGKPFLDKPNEQGSAPRLPRDPIPVPLPRPKQEVIQTFSNNQLGTFGTQVATFGSISSGEEGNLVPAQSVLLTQLQGQYFNSP